MRSSVPRSYLSGVRSVNEDQEGFTGGNRRHLPCSPSGESFYLDSGQTGNPRIVDVYGTVLELVEDYRDRCLWFLRQDYVPRTPDEILRVLEMIERYGDRAAYRRAQEIREWLSQPSRQES
jgi:hypothetical protein